MGPSELGDGAIGEGGMRVGPCEVGDRALGQGVMRGGWGSRGGAGELGRRHAWGTGGRCGVVDLGWLDNQVGRWDRGDGGMR